MDFCLGETAVCAAASDPALSCFCSCKIKSKSVFMRCKTGPVASRFWTANSFAYALAPSIKLLSSLKNKCSLSRPIVLSFSQLSDKLHSTKCFSIERSEEHTSELQSHV